MKTQRIISMKFISLSFNLGFFLVISNVIFFSFVHDVKTLYLCGISMKYYFYLFYIHFLFFYLTQYLVELFHYCKSNILTSEYSMINSKFQQQLNSIIKRS
jgi:hypothetical protein